MTFISDMFCATDLPVEFVGGPWTQKTRRLARGKIRGRLDYLPKYRDQSLYVRCVMEGLYPLCFTFDIVMMGNWPLDKKEQQVEKCNEMAHY